MPDRMKSAALALLGFSLYACGDAIMKYLTARYALTTILFGSALAIVVLFLLVAFAAGRPRRWLGVTEPRWHVFRGLLLVTELSALIYSFAHTSLAQTYAIIFCAPFITAILAHLVWRDAIGTRQWLAVLLGFGGVLVILRPGLIPLNGAALAALIAACAFAGLNLLTRPAGAQGASVLALAFWPEAVATICFLPAFLHHPEWPHGIDWLWFIMIGLFSGAGFCAASLAFLRGPAALVAPFEYSQMLWAILFGALFFGDRLDLWTGGGALVVIAAGFLLIGKAHDPAAAAASD